MEVLNLIVPVFAVMVTGYVFARLGFLPEEIGTALIQFVFKVSIPALLFLAIAQEEIDNLLDWPFIAAFGGVTVVLFGLILLGDHYWRKTGFGPATMMATICVGSNTGIIALPLLHSMFGKEAVLPAAIANIIVVALFLIQILILEAIRLKDPQDTDSTLAHIKNAVLNPVISSTILGILFAMTPYQLPTLITDYLDLFAAALTPCALFAIGMSMSPAAVVNSGPRIVFAALVKLIALPAIVFAVARLLELDPLLTIAAVVAAAVPTAKTEFVMAKQYHVSEELVANTISLTTVLAVVSLIVWLVLLSYVYPTAFKL